MSGRAMLPMVFMATILGGLISMADGWDYLWGQWDEKRNTETSVVFTPTNITISVNGSQEVWTVIGGTNLVDGLTVQRGDQKLEAKSSVKLEEMMFHCGQRSWLLRKAGSKDTEGTGKATNQSVR